jgi:hypothetical protein
MKLSGLLNSLASDFRFSPSYRQSPRVAKPCPA